MGSYYESDCNGCPECIGCGRKYSDHIIWECDKCGNQEDVLYYDKTGKEVCWECYKEQFLSKICDDMDETECANCGYEADIMYQIEGNEWVCEECLKEMAEKMED